LGQIKKAEGKAAKEFILETHGQIKALEENKTKGGRCSQPQGKKGTTAWDEKTWGCAGGLTSQSLANTI